MSRKNPPAAYEPPDRPEDLSWSVEATTRLRTYYADVEADMEKIRAARERIRIRNIEFRRYLADLNRDYPLFPNG